MFIIEIVTKNIGQNFLIFFLPLLNSFENLLVTQFYRFHTVQPNNQRTNKFWNSLQSQPFFASHSQLKLRTRDSPALSRQQGFSHPYTTKKYIFWNTSKSCSVSVNIKNLSIWFTKSNGTSLHLPVRKQLWSFLVF